MINMIIPKEKLLIWISIISLILITIIYLITNYKCVGMVLSSKYEIENTDQDRRTFIESFGIKLKNTKAVKETVVIPEEFDATYEEYEKIQNEMGLSLENFKGQKITKYTYEVDSPNNILYANIFIYDKFVVACDIVNPDFKNGFIKSFADYIN